MALSFPLSAARFMSTLKVVDAPFWQERQDMMSGTGGGEMIVSEITPPRWRCQVQCAPATLAEVAAIEAMLEAIGPHSFHVFNPRKPYPAADPDGSEISGFIPTVHALGASNRTMRVSGLPSAYTISAGDMIGYTSGALRAVHRVVETVTAAGTTTPFFEITPPLKPFAAVNANVTLVRPTVLMKIVWGGYSPPTANAAISQGITFDAVEVRA